MLNESDSRTCGVTTPVQRRTNVVFPPHGEVKGSERDVEKEGMFLCQRLVEETSTGKEFKHIRWISWNIPVPSILQGMRRPVCGLVALCMAGRMLKRHDPNITVYENDEALLKVAQNMGFTKQGEMFSAKQYAQLAQKVYDCEAKVLDDTLLNSAKQVLEHLASGYPILVPYDTDRNYEPCLRKGHKAHWAILTGFVIGRQKQFPNNKNDANSIAHITDSKELAEIFENLALNHSLVYVYAKQGKSARQQLWSFVALSESNANLKEVGPERDLTLYIIPKDGISDTLCSRSVLLYPKMKC